MATKKKARKAPPKRRAAKKAAPRKKKSGAKKKAIRRRTPRAARPRRKPQDGRELEERGADFPLTEPEDDRGLGPEAAGQSGDTEGLSRREIAASESVEELVEEGQAFEAGVISGVENARDGEEVTTHEVPEDDVPQEYLDEQ